MLELACGTTHPRATWVEALVTTRGIATGKPGGVLARQVFAVRDKLAEERLADVKAA